MSKRNFFHRFVKQVYLQVFAIRFSVPLVAALVLCGTLNAAEPPVKIYILAGQSNMGTFANRDTIEAFGKAYPDLEIPMKNVWYMEGSYRGVFKPERGWGVETPFGIDMTKGINEPILLFKSSQGGTTLKKDWLPPSSVKRLGGEVGYFYNRMIRRFHNMIQHIEEICPPVKERGYEIAGFIWFQGETDADQRDPEVWKDYEQKLRELIADVRRDVGVPNLPYLNIQINNIELWDGKPEKPKGGAMIREAQKKVAEEDPKGRWISTSNLSKGYHYDANSRLIIGQRMAEAMLPLAKEAVPTDPARIAAAGKVFKTRTYPDLKPDVSSLKKGLIFYLNFEDGEKTTIKDTVGGLAGKVVGEIKPCPGLFGNGISIPHSSDRYKSNSIQFPDFKDPAKDGKIQSLSVSFWVQTPTDTAGDVISKYRPAKKVDMMDG